MTNEKSAETVNVFKGTLPIGTLARTKQGALFNYTRFDRPLCFTMPTDPPQYEIQGINLHPFFAGLLPEGLRLEALKRAIKTSKDDLFSLLLASGSDTIGDVCIAQAKELPQPKKLEPVEIGEASFDQLFEQSLALGVSRDDLSIAGIQPKVSGGLISFPISIAKKRYQYILKLSPKEFPLLMENEAFFMGIAGVSGLEIPNFELVKDRDGRSGLLVERFDRLFDPSSKPNWKKAHQEDACQLLDRYPADKYLLSFREVAEAVEQYSSAPIVDSARLLRLKAFSYLIGNGDLHGKNVSLLTDPDTEITGLSPAYDLVSTFPYGDMTMALQMEGKRDNLKRRDFMAFAKRVGVREAPMTSALNGILDPLGEWLPRLEEIGFDAETTGKLRKLIQKRARDLR